MIDFDLKFEFRFVMYIHDVPALHVKNGTTILFN